MSLTEELRKLAELHQEGHLNEQEFADAKRRLISESRARTTYAAKDLRSSSSIHREKLSVESLVVRQFLFS